MCPCSCKVGTSLRLHTYSVWHKHASLLQPVRARERERGGERGGGEREGERGRGREGGRGEREREGGRGEREGGREGGRGEREGGRGEREGGERERGRENNGNTITQSVCTHILCM